MSSTSHTVQSIPNQPPRKSTSGQSGLSGVLSGLGATLILHPIEVLKVRMQADARFSSHMSFREVLKTTTATGYYVGLSANAVASMGAWGIFFGLYDQFKHIGLGLHHKYSPYQEVSTSRQVTIDFFASIFASSIAQVFTSPLWLMKTRMSLNNIPLVTQLKDGKPQIHIDPNSPYRRLVPGLCHIYKTEGFRGLYKGFSASLLGSTHGAIVMCSYQQLKKPFDNLQERQKHNIFTSYLSTLPSWFQTLFMSTYAAFLSKAIGTIVTYPTQVIRTGIQDHRLLEVQGTQFGFFSSARDIWKSNGIFGFYRGLTMQLLRSSLGNVLVFGFYEAFKKTIAKKTKEIEAQSNRTNI